MHRRAFFAFVGSIAGSAAIAHAGFRLEPSKKPDKNPAAGNQKANAPAAKFDDRFAGAFTNGEGGIAGAGWQLQIAAAGTYRSNVETCIHLGQWDTGAAAYAENRLTLTPDGQNAKPFTLIPVEWGTRLYLIWPESMKAFVEDLNNGSEPRHDAQGRHLLRVGDWRKDVEGRPHLPDPELAKLIENPTTAKVVAVENNVAKMTIDGSAALAAGAKMFVISPAVLRGRQMELASVEMEHATVTLKAGSRLPIGAVLSNRSWA